MDKIYSVAMFLAALIILDANMALRFARAADDRDTVSDLNKAAQVAWDKGEFTSAIIVFEEAVDAATSVYGQSDGRTADAEIELAIALRAVGQFDNSNAAVHRAERIRELKFGRSDPRTAECLEMLANNYGQQARFDDAAPLFREAVKSFEEHPMCRDKLATSLCDLGILYSNMGDHAAARKVLNRSLEIRRSAGMNTPGVADDLEQVAWLDTLDGLYNDAEVRFDQALKIREVARGQERIYLAKSLSGLAYLYSSIGHPARAVEAGERALQIAERGYPPDSQELAECLACAAAAYHAAGKESDAMHALERCIAIDERLFPPNHPAIATNLATLASVYLAADRARDAERALIRSLSVDEVRSGPSSAVVATDCYNLAAVYAAMQDFQKAECMLVRALAIRQHILGSDDLAVADVLHDLGALHSIIGKKDEACDELARSFKIRQLRLQPSDPRLVETAAALTCLYEAMGSLDEAKYYAQIRDSISVHVPPQGSER